MGKIGRAFQRQFYGTVVPAAMLLVSPCPGDTSDPVPGGNMLEALGRGN